MSVRCLLGISTVSFNCASSYFLDFILVNVFFTMDPSSLLLDIANWGGDFFELTPSKASIHIVTFASSHFVLKRFEGTSEVDFNFSGSYCCSYVFMRSYPNETHSLRGFDECLLLTLQAWPFSILLNFACSRFIMPDAVCIAVSRNLIMRPLSLSSLLFRRRSSELLL